MIYTTTYKSPIGNLLIAAKDNKLIGLWIESQKYYLSGFKEEMSEREDVEILTKTKSWLDRYFNKEKPDINELDIKLIGSEFRKSVWKILKTIPYGKVVTYNDIAKKNAEQKGISKMSAQAIGGALGVPKWMALLNSIVFLIIGVLFRKINPKNFKICLVL